MEFFSEWLMIVVLMIVAAASPGPDFVLAIRNALTYSRQTGIFTAIGLALGVCVHTAYCILGIAALISKSIVLFNVIKYLGAAYLVYIGIRALLSKGFTDAQDNISRARTDIHWSKALGMGFLTNILNPKATMFFLALFTQVIEPGTPVSVQIVFALTCAVIVGAWFSFVALVLSSAPVRQKFLGVSQWIDRVCGGAMIGLGLRLALARTNA
ncbi:MAG TPA: LysE family transporter [Alphaproteobacteria bacterium]|nr:LysE family transporter [Micavibrio sp.]HQX26458.1 LysE family transporter [Alphaproteobacteria bacterium]